MIRVLRLIEYEYDTPERAEQDMGRWNVPANGSYGRASGLKIRSAIIPNLDFTPETEESEHAG